MKILRDCSSLLKPLEDIGIRGADILDYIGCAAMLHDLGKCLTVGVINCQGRRLTEDEFECIKLHPKRALVFLKDDSDFNPYIDIMIGHHKFYDGSGGYPIDFDNTKSKYRIAIDIISIADSIDAATDILGRNYTMGKDFNTLLMELKESMGKRYNPDIVSLILEDDELKDRLTYLVTEGREKVYFMAYKEIKES
jgi:HD-GYP domain-containing protein (c-di-GMP phosphodiesterase class II)